MDRILFDYSKLRGKIREVMKTQAVFAQEIGISEATLSHKLSNVVSFSQNEIEAACKLLNVSLQEIPVYFFTQIVKKSLIYH